LIAFSRTVLGAQARLATLLSL